jgi:hypothetical protein
MQHAKAMLATLLFFALKAGERPLRKAQCGCSQEMARPPLMEKGAQRFSWKEHGCQFAAAVSALGPQE